MNYRLLVLFFLLIINSFLYSNERQKMRLGLDIKPINEKGQIVKGEFYNEYKFKDFNGKILNLKLWFNKERIVRAEFSNPNIFKNIKKTKGKRHYEKYIFKEGKKIFFIEVVYVRSKFVKKGYFYSHRDIYANKQLVDREALYFSLFTLDNLKTKWTISAEFPPIIVKQPKVTHEKIKSTLKRSYEGSYGVEEVKMDGPDGIRMTVHNRFKTKEEAIAYNKKMELEKKGKEEDNSLIYPKK